jgi:hypothetical protein
VLFKTDESSSSKQIGEPFKCGVPDLLIFFLIAGVSYVWSSFSAALFSQSSDALG